MSGALAFGALLAPPLAAAAVAAAVRPYRRPVGLAHGGLALVVVAAALALGARAATGEVIAWGPAELLRVDALSALLAVTVALVGALAAWLGPGMDDGGAGAPLEARRFHVFAPLFTFTMLLAVTANNVAIMWVAIEATTIMSAVLVPLHVTRASVEASWKYILIGSVGIALAFIGTVLAYFDFVQLVGGDASALNWPVLVSAAPRMHPEVVRLAFVFLLVGYGTKAGLAPMHTWLPEAHSEAPAALSAMMSGVLLAVALYAVLRWKAVADAAGAGALTDGLLITLGLASVLVAALSLLAQSSVKRLLAYSSIEHIGLACLALGLGPAGVFAALLHVVNHAAAKSMLFLLAGRILGRYGSADLDRVAGLARVMPVTAGLFAAGMVALMGLPPFGVFVSKFAVVRAGFAQGRPGLMAAVLALLAVGFAGLLTALGRVLWGAAPDDVARGEGPAWALVPLGGCVALLLLTGLLLPRPLAALLQGAVAAVSR